MAKRRFNFEDQSDSVEDASLRDIAETVIGLTDENKNDEIPDGKSCVFGEKNPNAGKPNYLSFKIAIKGDLFYNEYNRDEKYDLIKVV